MAMETKIFERFTAFLLAPLSLDSAPWCDSTESVKWSSSELLSLILEATVRNVCVEIGVFRNFVLGTILWVRTMSLGSEATHGLPKVTKINCVDSIQIAVPKSEIPSVHLTFTYDKQKHASILGFIIYGNNIDS
jgi:hypothetical protein